MRNRPLPLYYKLPTGYVSVGNKIKNPPKDGFSGYFRPITYPLGPWVCSKDMPFDKEFVSKYAGSNANPKTAKIILSGKLVGSQCGEWEYAVHKNSSVYKNRANNA